MRGVTQSGGGKEGDSNSGQLGWTDMEKVMREVSLAMRSSFCLHIGFEASRFPSKIVNTPTLYWLFCHDG